MYLLCDKSACQCLTKITAIQCGLADSNSHSDLCFLLQEVRPENTEHRFLVQSRVQLRYKPERKNIDGACAHRWTHLVQATVKLERRLCLHSFYSSFRSLHCWPTRPPAALYEGSLERPFVLHAHVFPVFSCEHAGGHLEVNTSRFIFSFFW